MTHVKIADAFARLVGFCTGYGGKYNPGRQNLRIDSLSNQLQEVTLALDQVRIAKSMYDNEVNKRKQTFQKLPRLAASVLRILEASGASQEKVDDARFFVHRITGKSALSREPVPSEQIPAGKVKRSHRQLAYASKADSFSKLVQTVITEPLYRALEPELSIEGLKAAVLELNNQNDRVMEARRRWSNSGIDRDQVMYTKNMSLYYTAKAVKKYVRAIYGLGSAEYGQLKGLQFIMQ